MTARTPHPPYYSTFPWGKYKGEPLADCPSTYLLWAFESANMEQDLEAAVRAELARRIGHNTQPHEWPRYRAQVPSHVDPAVAAEVIATGKRALSLKFHPDLGGSTAAMQEINTAADWLSKLLLDVFAEVPR